MKPQRPGVLFLSHCLPYPPHAGGLSRPFNILRQLSKDFDVDLLAFYRVNHQADTGTLEDAKAVLARTVSRLTGVFPVEAEHSKSRRIIDHARSLITRRPYSFYQYSSDGFRQALGEVLERRRPELVHFASIDLYRWLGEIPSEVPSTCTHQDVESSLLRQRSETTVGLVKRYVRFQANLVEDTERAVCRRFATNIVMSGIDAARLEKVSPGARTLVVPNGVDTGYFRADHSTPRVPDRVVFIGPTYSFANRDAVRFFLSEVWPMVRAVRGQATLDLIGKGSAPDHADFMSHPGVRCLGYVPDIRLHLSQASCSVVPIRLGGGTRLKVLDSWAMETPVVSTSIGCEGLQALDGENIFVRDTAEGFADAILNVLTNADVSRKLAGNGRRVVEDLYSWDVIGQRLRSHYRKLLRATQ
jgi:glycosyltransferase involved in cell wall biosynthesis